jgi:hypothetical protein
MAPDSIVEFALFFFALFKKEKKNFCYNGDISLSKHLVRPIGIVS